MQIKNNPAVLIHCFFADHLPWLLNWRNTNIKLFMVKDEFTQNNLKLHVVKEALPSGSDGKASAMPRLGFDPWVGKIPRRRKWQPAPVFLPRKSHGPRSLVSYRPWGRKELDTTERLHFTSQERKANSLTAKMTALASWRHKTLSLKPPCPRQNTTK